MKIRRTVAFAVAAMLTAGGVYGEDVQWVRVTVLLEQGPREAQQHSESLIRGGIYSIAEVERRGLEAIDAEILDRVQFLAGEIHDVEQSMRLGTLLSRQYYLPLRVGQNAVLPIIDLNPRLGIVLKPQRFVGDRVVCKVQFLEPEGPPGTTEFTGDPITLRLQDADLQAVLGTFSKITPFTIEVDPSVSGTVTVDLREVPWDQALDLILRINNLGWKADGDTLKIAPIDELSQRKRVRTEATINLPRGAEGSATIASRGDAENRTVVLVVESVGGEPELVAERDGLVRPPAIGMTSRDVLDETAMGDVLVFRGKATEEGDLEDVEILAKPFSEGPEMFLEVTRTWRPWTVLDKQVRRVEAVVGYGLRITHAPPSDLTATTSVDRIGIEVEVSPPPPEMVKTYPDHHIVSVYLNDLDTGNIISAPRIPVRRGEEGTVRSYIPGPNGKHSDFEMKVLIAEDGSHVSYSWTVTSDGKVLSSHTAEFEL
jgi:hypothetical protein